MKRYELIKTEASENALAWKRRPYELFREMKARILKTLQDGFWFCHTCESPTEIILGENGVPNHCGRCHSPRIEFVPPMKPTPAEQFARMKEEVLS